MSLTIQQIELSNWVEFGVAAGSFICSSLTLIIIYYLRSWNGYLLLISTMVFFQMIYDVNFLLGIVPGYRACLAWNFLDILGGLAVSFWSNVISFVVLYVVVKVKSLDIFVSYFKFSLFATLIPLVLSITVFFVVVHANVDDDLPFEFCVYDTTPLATFVSQTYYWARLVSIGFNIAVFLFINARIRKMNYAVKASVSDSRVTTVNNPINSMSSATFTNSIATPPQVISVDQKNSAVMTLISRIKYYPIAQVIARSGAIWNEYDNYHYSTYISVMLNAVTGPCLGILCFLIFLFMQPTARNTLKRIFCCQCSTAGNIIRESRLISSHASLFRATFHDFNEDDLESIIDDRFSVSRDSRFESSLANSITSGRASYMASTQSTSSGL